MREFGINIGHPGQRLITGFGGQSERDVPDDNAGLIPCDMREAWPVDHVSKGINVSLRRSQSRIDRYPPRAICNACGFETDILQIWLAAGGDEEMRAGNLSNESSAVDGDLDECVFVANRLDAGVLDQKDAVLCEASAQNVDEIRLIMLRSMRIVLSPSCALPAATDRPADPAPITQTSHFKFAM